jgi:hypothetical protein
MLFSRKKLVIKPGSGYRYQYGKSPILTQIKTQKGGLKFSSGPTSFHTIRERNLRFSRIIAKIPRKAKIIIVLLAVIGVAAFLIHSIFFSQYFAIETIKAPNTITDSLQNYKGKNILFIKKDDIIAKISASYPEIENITVEKDLPNTLVVSFTEYPLAANITNITEGASKKFIINSIGYVTKENTDDPTLPYIKIKTDSPINTESAILDAEKLKYILGAVSYFEEKFGMKILESEYLVVPRELHLKTEKFFFIWLDIQKPFEDQFKKLKKALVKLNIYEEPLQYIDLRITGESGEKIIYKRR